MERESDVTQGRFQAGRERAVVPVSEDDLLNSENRDAMKGISRFLLTIGSFFLLHMDGTSQAQSTKDSTFFVIRVVFCNKRSPQSVLIRKK